MAHTEELLTLRALGLVGTRALSPITVIFARNSDGWTSVGGDESWTCNWCASYAVHDTAARWLVYGQSLLWCVSMGFSRHNSPLYSPVRRDSFPSHRRHQGEAAESQRMSIAIVNSDGSHRCAPCYHTPHH